MNSVPITRHVRASQNGCAPPSQIRPNEMSSVPCTAPVAGQRSFGRASMCLPASADTSAPAAPASANRPISSWLNPYRGPLSRNETAVQNALNAPNPQAPIRPRQRSTGWARATFRVSRSWAKYPVCISGGRSGSARWRMRVVAAITTAAIA